MEPLLRTAGSPASETINSYFNLLSKEPAIHFVPENEYKHFFFNYSRFGDGAARISEADQNALMNIAALERLEIAAALLKTADRAKVFFFIEDEEARKSLETKIRNFLPELRKFLDNGRFLLTLNRGPQEVWAQDFGEAVGGENPCYAAGWTPKSYSKPRRENRKTEEIQGIRKIVIPAVLQGGNVTKAIAEDGKKYVIIGSNDIIYTKNEYDDRYKYKIGDFELKEIYRRAFGADDVIVLGQGVKQPRKMFHIDQAVFFPAKGVAVLAKPIDPENLDEDYRKEILTALAKYKKQLEDARFRVIEIPAYADSIKHYQAYTNSIPLKSSDGKATVIMPSFAEPDAPAEISAKINKNEADIRRILEQNGIDVIFIRDRIFDAQGGVHCMTGALSYYWSNERKQNEFLKRSMEPSERG